MASCYKGLYVYHSDNGDIDYVQVVDTGDKVDTCRSGIPLPSDEYIKRGIKPPIDELPDREEYHSKK